MITDNSCLSYTRVARSLDEVDCAATEEQYTAAHYENVVSGCEDDINAQQLYTNMSMVFQQCCGVHPFQTYSAVQHHYNQDN
eukprot:scaffold13377_cov117-Skeletonema_marinoi.AAC.3